MDNAFFLSGRGASIRVSAWRIRRLAYVVSYADDRRRQSKTSPKMPLGSGALRDLNGVTNNENWYSWLQLPV